MTIIAAIVAMLAILAGFMLPDDQTESESVGLSASAPSVTSTQPIAPVANVTPSQTSNLGHVPVDALGSTPASTAPPPTTPTEPAQTVIQPAVEILSVAPPSFEAPVTGKGVNAYYTDAYTFDVFTIRWRAGAFPPERAQEVAVQAREALDRINAILGTNDQGPFEILLADRMFDDTCFGCQGFAASDYRQVFILQDGSVAPDEFEALLIHEISHVIAGNYIEMPHDAGLFFAEGLATWIMSPDLVEAGYIPPIQIAAWAHSTGRLPTVWELLFDAQYEGRTRARIEYDPAESFTQFVIETYGMDAYQQLYTRDLLPEDIIGKDWETLEQEWHTYLSQWGNNVVNGVDGETWWRTAELVISGFDRIFDDPASVTQEQYALLASARVALNRGDIQTAVHLANQSGLVAMTAN